MVQEKSAMELLQEKINECDDLIVEISQLRYQLDDILLLLSKRTEKISQPHDNEKLTRCTIDF
jgi:hypothetical protein